MNSAIRFLFMVVGPLLIVGATVIFLRGIGDILPPIMGAGLAFVAGLALLWLAFKPHPVAHAVRQAAGELPEIESYDRTALARLQESMEPQRKSSERS
ncbi:MAG: hypothetical protein O2968_10145 [Acidobacteria bacterium]|nr:hypothetical protein [Acidobacteriota bacterium]